MAITTLPVLPIPPNTATDAETVFLERADAFNPALKAWGESFNTMVPQLNSDLENVAPAVQTAITKAAEASASAASASSSAATATTQAGIATTKAGIATTKASESAASAASAAQSAADAAAIVGLDVSTVPAPDKVPQALSTGKLDAGWLPPIKSALVIPDPTISGADLVAVGGDNTFTLSADAGLNNVTIASFKASITGQSEQTVSAVSGTANVTFAIPAGTADGTQLTITAVAVDSLGNTSNIVTKTVTATTNYVSAPTIIHPTVSGAAWVGVRVVLSDFVTVGATDTWAKTDIQIVNPATSEVLVDASNLTGDSIVKEYQTYGWLFSAGQTVKVRARYHGTTLGAGLWAETTVTFASTLHGAVVGGEGLAFGNVADGSPLALSWLPSSTTCVYEIIPFADKRASANLGAVAWDTGTAADIECLPNVALTANTLDASATDHSSRGNYISNDTTDAQLRAAFPLETGCGWYNTGLLKYYKAGTTYAAALASLGMTVGGLQCGLPSIPETCVIRRAKDYIEAQDATASLYPTVAIGTHTQWSSSEYSSNGVWFVATNGYVNGPYKNAEYGVLPVAAIPSSPLGLVGGSEADPILLPNGRKLWISESGNRWVLEYSRGSVRRKITGPWCNHRTTAKFGTYGTDTSLVNVAMVSTKLDAIWNPTSRGNYLTPNTTDAQIYAAMSSETGNGHSNCDVWMTYASQTDSQNIVGVPAVQFCRDLNIDGMVFDCPDIIDLCAVFCARQWIDLLDPYTTQYPTFSLMNWGFGKSYVWSSSECTSGYVWDVNTDGGVLGIVKGLECGVLPVAAIS